jgi:type I restriction enzyme, R subunit
MSATQPEQLARQQIDQQLAAAGWAVQDYRQFHPNAARAIALREVPLKTGPCDYLLLVDKKPLGVIEAKKIGATLSSVQQQTASYSSALPEFLAQLAGTHASQLPFLYESTGVETFFRDMRDPAPRARGVFNFHRPETLAEWAAQPITLRERLQHLPPLDMHGLRQCQIEAVTNLEKSHAQDLPRALIQMATGAGKTFTAATFAYRLIKHAGARRILFLVDRTNLAEQTMAEFDQYTLPGDGRKFTQVYNVQHLQGPHIDPVARVTIATMQRVYSMLRGEELPEGADDLTGAEAASLLTVRAEPVEAFANPSTSSGRTGVNVARTADVEYNPSIPPETFDFIVTDECHRSIYNLWRQVLEYFDAHLIGLTATPSKQTIGFFNQNLVMEYGYERAVLDKVNVDHIVWRIKTEVSTDGGKVEAGLFVDKRDRQTRAQRWEQLDEDLEFKPTELDRSVVVPSQIRTVLQAFKDAMPVLFNGRSMLPKTLIFAKDDAHAEDIVAMVKEVFGKGDEFCSKITHKYFDKAERTYKKPKDLITAFRNSPAMRVAVTVDMIATGTDIKALECLVFMRDVKSRTYFEQMKGRGTRTISPTDLQARSGIEAADKDRFVIFDAVGVTESIKTDSAPLDREPGVNFKDLMLRVAFGDQTEGSLLSLASRVVRLDNQLDAPQRKQVREALAASGFAGLDLTAIAQNLRRVSDADELQGTIDSIAGRAGTTSLNPDLGFESIRKTLVDEACKPFGDPALRNLLETLKLRNEQTIATAVIDTLLTSELDQAARDKARSLTTSFAQFIEQHHAEIEALQVLYSRPRRLRLTDAMLEDLEAKLKASPDHFTKEALWRAYQIQAETGSAESAGNAGNNAKAVQGKVQRVTDLISLVRYAMHTAPVLEPFEAHVHARYATWLAAKSAAGTVFTEDEKSWLAKMRDRIIASGSIDRNALNASNDLGPAWRVFGERLDGVMDELNEVLV